MHANTCHHAHIRMPSCTHIHATRKPTAGGATYLVGALVAREVASAAAGIKEPLAFVLVVLIAARQHLGGGVRERG